MDVVSVDLGLNVGGQTSTTSTQNERDMHMSDEKLKKRSMVSECSW